MEADKAPSPEFLAPLALPRRFAGALLADITSGPIVSLAARYMSAWDVVAARGLAPALCGVGGQWKTYCAAALTRWVYAQGYDCEFVQCAAELPALERARFAHSTATRLDALATVPWLVLDDFAVVRDGSYAADVLTELAERRYADLRPTMYTGNTSLETQALGSRFGVCFARRFEVGSEGYRLMLG